MFPRGTVSFPEVDPRRKIIPQIIIGITLYNLNSIA
jgi:hypothetical protein